MKRFLALLLASLFAFSMFACSGNTPTEETPDEKVPAGKTFYVSPDGNDANDGSESTPLATLEGAKQAIQKYKNENGLPDGGIEAVFKSGTYKITSTLEFLPEDSGEADKPIIFRAEENAEVIFDGGVTLNGSDFVPASDDIKNRVADENAKKNLLEIDLTAAGCFDLESRTDYGTGWGSDSYRQELYVDNERQVLAQWPNDGAYETKGKYTEKLQLNIPEEKYELWKNAKTIEYYGAPEYDWNMIRAFVGAVLVNEENKTLDIDSSVVSSCDPSKRSTFWVYNIPEEIDIPGEYWWDVQTNKLYYYPDGDLTNKKIVFSQYKDSFILLSGVNHILFEGLTFENARTAAIAGTNMDTAYVNIENCTFRCIGVNAIAFRGYNIYIADNEFYQLGSGGVSLRGGSIAEFKRSDSVVTNNKIYDFGQTYMVYQAGVYTNGLGFTISHNEIFNAPHFAINPDSGETLIEYNDVHDVCKCTSDSGAIYLGRRWDWAGNVIRYNYIHDIIDVAHNGTPLGIYLDDQVSGQHVYSNLLVNVSGNAIGVCSGKYNIVENNIIVNCKNVPISNDQRGLGFAANHCSYPTGYMWGTMLGTEPYSKFMALARPENLLHVEAVKSSIYNIDDPGICSYTVIRDNVSYGDYEIEVYDEIEYSDLYKDELPFDGITSLIPMMRLYNTYEGNEYYPVGTDIGFVDEENSNYFLRDDSRVYRDIPGFEKIQFDKIGIID